MTHPCVSDLAFGERVHIDGNRSFAGTVVGLRFHAGQLYPLVQVSWIYQGVVHFEWMERWRLEVADDLPLPLPPPSSTRRRKLEVVA